MQPFHSRQSSPCTRDKFSAHAGVAVHCLSFLCCMLWSCAVSQAGMLGCWGCIESQEERRRRNILHVSARQHVRSHAAWPNDPASYHQFATIMFVSPQAQRPKHHRTHQSQYHNVHKFRDVKTTAQQPKWRHHRQRRAPYYQNQQ